MSFYRKAILLCWMVASLPAEVSVSAMQDNLVHLNQIQMIGTHNSYHAGLAPSEMKLMQMRSPRTAEALDYSHPPLREQLDAGIRQIELDVFADPQGGRFAHLNVVPKAAAAGLPADPDFDPDHEMDKPGFKVMHLQDVDQRSRCRLLVSCLQEVRGWSKAHSQHLPIFILIECKQARVTDASGAQQVEVMTPELFNALDGEIRSVFSRSEIITPDDVRGKHASLSEAITRDGWPTLAKARGRVMFLLDNADLASVYAQGHAALSGRVLFPNAEPSTPDAAFVERNDGPESQIEALVKQGYLVRTRADADTLEARRNATKRRDAALASGAQFVSTDYPAPEPARWTNYSVSFPDARMARCNPVNGPESCRGYLLENAGK